MSRSISAFQFKRIGSRLGAGFGVVLFLMLAMLLAAGLQLWRIQVHNAENDRHNANLVLVQEWSALVRTNLDRALTATRIDAAIGDNEAVRGQMTAVLNRLNEDMAATATATTELQKKLDGAQEGSVLAAQVTKINQSRARFVSLRAQVRDDIQMGEEAGKRIDAELVPLSNAMLKALDELVASLKEQSGAATRQLATAVIQAGIVLAAICALALVTGALIAWLTSRAITNPMRDAVAIAQNIANGELSHEFQTTRPDEIGSMLRRLSQMQEKLHAAFAEISEVAEKIERASQEVAGGNADLSARTERAAGSLQETAASVEELTGTIRQTGESARTVNQLAESASQVAQRGGEVVTQVVRTMGEISESSSRIASIIGVIDGIAFQTNILALNAAVEAARAGEQGRGFAVVASEVRSLAGRSAEAAREIKDLINSSVAKVETGAALVQQAGSTMDEIVASIQRVTGIIAAINAKSAEQTQGIDQINGAINQLDKMTQQNAALVEESSAAAVSLKDQAHTLNLIMGRFHLARSQAPGLPAPQADSGRRHSHSSTSAMQVQAISTTQGEVTAQIR